MLWNGIKPGQQKTLFDTLLYVLAWFSIKQLFILIALLVLKILWWVWKVGNSRVKSRIVFWKITLLGNYSRLALVNRKAFHFCFYIKFLLEGQKLIHCDSSHSFKVEMITISTSHSTYRGLWWALRMSLISVEPSYRDQVMMWWISYFLSNVQSRITLKMLLSADWTVDRASEEKKGVGKKKCQAPDQSCQ